MFEFGLCAALGEWRRKKQKTGLVFGQGVNSCRRYGAGQGGKTKIDGPELFHSLCSLNLVKLLEL